MNFRILLSAALLGPSPGAERVTFEEDIQPILEAHCTKCHGEKKQKSGLRLDSAEGLRRGGDSGEPLFVTGERGKSYLYKLVSREDPEEAMPP